MKSVLNIWVFCVALVSGLVIILPQTAIADTASGNFNIGSINSVANLLDIVVVPQSTQGLSTESCASSTEYCLEWNNENREHIKQLQTALTAAFLSGAQVNLTLSGCVGNRSKVIGVSNANS